jgi:serine/threonine protein kinase
MERLPGTTLRDEIGRGSLATSRVLLVVTEALTALVAAHKFGVLHRDIKPTNILLQDDGHTKITDFGIARTVDVRTGAEVTEDLTLTGVVLGTPGYLAPEGRSVHPATAQSDVYSVGAVMVEALTGRRAAPGAPPDGGATSNSARHRPSSAGDPTEPAVRAGGGNAARPAALRPTVVAAPHAATQPMAPGPAVSLPVALAAPGPVPGRPHSRWGPALADRYRCPHPHAGGDDRCGPPAR